VLEDRWRHVRHSQHGMLMPRRAFVRALRFHRQLSILWAVWLECCFLQLSDQQCLCHFVAAVPSKAFKLSSYCKLC
jgi:hypothetical protein